MDETAAELIELQRLLDELRTRVGAPDVDHDAGAQAVGPATRRRTAVARRPEHRDRHCRGPSRGSPPWTGTSCTVAGTSPRRSTHRRRASCAPGRRSARPTPHVTASACSPRTVALLDGDERQQLREHFIAPYGSDPESWGGRHRLLPHRRGLDGRLRDDRRGAGRDRRRPRRAVALTDPAAAPSPFGRARDRTSGRIGDAMTSLPLVFDAPRRANPPRTSPTSTPPPVAMRSAELGLPAFRADQLAATTSAGWRTTRRA